MQRLDGLLDAPRTSAKTIDNAKVRVVLLARWVGAAQRTLYAPMAGE
ncbi:MAG: hypothetical protein IPM01_13320 [Burkholderiaceae bacterium]|nr:hypothetical protein [Burkholderiaceae bacterium]